MPRIQPRGPNGQFLPWSYANNPEQAADDFGSQHLQDLSTPILGPSTTNPDFYLEAVYFNPTTGVVTTADVVVQAPRGVSQEALRLRAAAVILGGGTFDNSSPLVDMAEALAEGTLGITDILEG